MEKIFNSVFPIIIERNNEPEQIGSGVLLEIKNQLFLLTAAHVFDDLQKYPLLIPTNSGLTKTDFSAAYIPILDEGRSADKLDIAYLKFDYKLKEIFQESISPLTLNNIDVTDYKEKYDIYTFAGFPHRKTKYKENRIISELYSYTGGLASKETYENLSYAHHTNILIDFNRKKTINRLANEISIAPLPHGISGGGIFSYSKDPTRLITENNIYRLVGIAHSYHENKRILAGTSINLYLDLIFKNNPILLDSLDGAREWTPIIYCLTYFRKEDWKIIKSTLDDANKLHSTWEEWRISAEKYIENLSNENKQCIRVIFDMESFKDYCKRKNLPLTSRSRINYSSEILAREMLEKKISFIIN